MSYASLFDPQAPMTVAVDAAKGLFTLEEKGLLRHIRLSAPIARVLWALFEAHPGFLTYDACGDILRTHNLHIPDNPRIHRHMSQLRRLLTDFDPRLEDLIVNQRGAGYALHERLQNRDGFSQDRDNDLYGDPALGPALQDLDALVQEAVALAKILHVVPHPMGFVLDTSRHTQKISDLLDRHTRLHQDLKMTLSLHPHEMMALRLDALMSKLATYIGMARLCAYPITQTQWAQWYTQEVGALLIDIKKCVGFVRQG
ncbi:MAG: helix-turn-helix domain-containing protein [Proteobacteria bacterium]|nr:helix-turn-helix domain-containing protein [Pseudomonadota bacterium]